MKMSVNPRTGLLEIVQNRAVDITIQDSGGYYSGSSVEAALQEIGSGATLGGLFLLLDGSNGPMSGALGIDVDSASALRVRQADQTVVFNVDTASAQPTVTIYGADGVDSVQIYNNGTSGVIYSNTASLVQNSLNRIFIYGSVPGAGSPRITQYCGTGGRSAVSLGRGTNEFLRFEYKDNTLESIWSVYPTAGNQTIFTNTIYVNADFDHPNQSSPTWFFQYGNPDVDATLWGSITFNGTNFFFGLGSGSFVFDGNMVIGSGGSGIDYSLTFNGETNDGVITWMEDENYFLFGNNVKVGDNTIFFDEISLFNTATNVLEMASGNYFRINLASLLIDDGNSASPSYGISFGSGNDVVVYRSAADTLGLGSGDSLNISNTGSLQFGTTISIGYGTDNRLDLADGDTLRIVGGQLQLDLDNTGNTQGIVFGTTQDVNIYRDANGNLQTDDDFVAVSIGAGNAAPSGVLLYAISTSTPIARLELNDKSVVSNQQVGGYEFFAGEGTAAVVGEMAIYAGGTWTSTSSPSFLAWGTTAAGTTSRNMNMFLSANGQLQIADNPISTSSSGQLTVNYGYDAGSDLNNAALHHILLSNPNNVNGEAFGIAFQGSGTAGNHTASILARRTGTAGLGELNFYTKQSTTNGADPTLVLTLGSNGELSHFGSGFGIYGTPATAQATGYTTFSNLSPDRTLDADSTTIDEIADVLGTLIEDLKLTGIIAA